MPLSVRNFMVIFLTGSPREPVKFSNFSDSVDFGGRIREPSQANYAHCISFKGNSKNFLSMGILGCLPLSRDMAPQTLPILRLSKFFQSLTRNFSAIQ